MREPRATVPDRSRTPVTKPNRSPGACRSCTRLPSGAYAWTQSVCAGRGWNRAGSAQTDLRSAGLRGSSQSSVRSRGLPIATQINPSDPVETLSGKPGRLSTNTESVPSATDHRRSRYAAVSATTTNDPSGASATPFANSSPASSVVVSVPSPRRSSRPVPECCSNSPFQWSIPIRPVESLK